MKYIKPIVKTYSDMPVAGGCGDQIGACQSMAFTRQGPGCGDQIYACQQQSHTR